MKITEIRQQKRRKNRYSLYTEDGFLFSLSDETIIGNGIKTGSEISGEEAERLRKEDTLKYAKETAFSYASYAPRTEKQVLEKLSRSGVDEKTAEAALETVRSYGYVDDGEFAREFARVQLKKYGPAVVIMKLRANGVDDSAARECVEELYSEENARNIFEAVGKKYAGLPERERKAKISAAMARKGFSWDEYGDLFREDD